MQSGPGLLDPTHLHPRRILAQTDIDCPSRRDNDPGPHSSIRRQTGSVPWNALYGAGQPGMLWLRGRSTNQPPEPGRPGIRTAPAILSGVSGGRRAPASFSHCQLATVFSAARQPTAAAPCHPSSSSPSRDRHDAVTGCFANVSRRFVYSSDPGCSPMPRKPVIISSCARLAAITQIAGSRPSSAAASPPPHPHARPRQRDRSPASAAERSPPASPMRASHGLTLRQQSETSMS